MRLGSGDGPVVVVALPLFEEANRTRAVAVATMRALAVLGIGSALPDLPGQGESLVPTQAATLSALRSAFGSAVAAIGAEGKAVYVAGIRSGALLDLSAPVRGRWHLSPQEGPALLRELKRIKQREVGRTRKLPPSQAGAAPPEAAPDPPVRIAGNLVCADLLSALTGATPYDAPDVPKRIVRLSGDPRPADRHLAGSPPWRRAEPGCDDVLAERLAADIAEWVRRCEDR
ncbi:hypothetical protein [Sphingomonas bacterium]|uniref:hypothetical protein n=1 Tax=Sphingomonas bacterium TaxID=1895847 RepID=UPI0020C60881|nr:hypothetical protein [Sphingomonas bacterium]